MIFLPLSTIFLPIGAASSSLPKSQIRGETDTHHKRCRYKEPQCLSTEEGRLADAFRRTLFVSSAGLEQAKKLVASYKTGEMQHMTPELWEAKKIVDSTLHPGTEYLSISH